MISRRVLRFAGIALGTGVGLAVAACPAAVADPIDAAWLYGVPVGPGAMPSDGVTLPGFPDTGSITADGFTYLHSVGGDPWYTVDDSTFNIPSLFSSDHQVVQTIIDSTSGYPTVGTVADHFELFPINTSFAGVIPLIQSYTLNDPELGSASSFALPGFANTLISDDAGIKDIVNFFGQTYTLFDFPASGAGSSEAGDGLGQLMSELLGGAAGSAAVPDLF